MSHQRPASDLGVGDVFLVSPGGAFPHERVIACQVAAVLGERLSVRVLNGNWRGTLCRRTGGGLSVATAGGGEHALVPDWRLAHVVEMSDGVAQLAERCDHDGIVEAAYAELSQMELLAA